MTYNSKLSITYFHGHDHPYWHLEQQYDLKEQYDQQPDDEMIWVELANPHANHYQLPTHLKEDNDSSHLPRQYHDL